MPWTRRVIGVSTCPRVAFIFSEGIWTYHKRVVGGGGDEPCTYKHNEARYTIRIGDL